MRELLFRGKRRDNGKWYFGSYLFLHVPDSDWTGRHRGPAKDVYFIVNQEDINEAVNPETVGQSTGLTDCNDKTIFEGDIVLDTATGEKYEILYNYGGFVMADNNRFFHGLSLRLGDDYEIIGNIHDNPELLRGGGGS